MIELKFALINWSTSLCSHFDFEFKLVPLLALLAQMSQISGDGSMVLALSTSIIHTVSHVRQDVVFGERKTKD